MGKIFILLALSISINSFSMQFSKTPTSIIAQDAQNKWAGHAIYNKDRCKLQALFVDKQYQKQGLGSKLFYKALKDMQNCSNVTWDAFSDAVGFYQKNGANIRETPVVNDPLNHSSYIPLYPMSISNKQIAALIKQTKLSKKLSANITKHFDFS